jgi:hypothetical protein
MIFTSILVLGMAIYIFRLLREIKKRSCDKIDTVQSSSETLETQISPRHFNNQATNMLHSPSQTQKGCCAWWSDLSQGQAYKFSFFVGLFLVTIGKLPILINYLQLDSPSLCTNPWASCSAKTLTKSVHLP